MKLSKVLVFLIVFITVLTSVGIYYNLDFLSASGHLFLMPLIGFWYGIKRNWQFGPIDRLMYLAYFIGSFADSLILIDWGTLSEFLQINTTLVMHFVFILVFRNEGTLVYTNRFKEVPKILLPALIVVLAFGSFVGPLVTDSLYFILIFYSVLEIILMSHGYFRPFKGKSYFWVAMGVTLIFLKDVIYCVHFFLLENSHPMLYMLQLSMSTFAYFMVAIGVSIAQNSNNENRYEKISLKGIKDSLTGIFKSKQKNNTQTSIYEYTSRHSSKITQ